MAHITGEIIIARPADVVFDYVADERNEPTYNPRMTRVDKLTDGPVGSGTRFRATFRSLGRTTRIVTELTAYERPTRLSSTTHMPGTEITGTLTFAPVPAGTQMRWSWEVTPKGALRLLTPLIAAVGGRQEAAIWAGLKRRLESTQLTG